MLDEWNGIEVEIEQMFKIPISDSAREQVSKEALSMVGMRAKTAKGEESKGRQFDSTICPSLSLLYAFDSVGM